MRRMTAPPRSFEANGLRFTHDLDGASVGEADTRPIDVALDPEDARLTSEAPLEEQLGERLSAMLGERVQDEEGIFDLAVERAGIVVAAVQLSCDDDAIELLGERAASLTEAALCEALIEALRG
jgi:hypothetical protein